MPLFLIEKCFLLSGVWAEGDLCQALCGWDNLFYSARIKKIFTGPPHRKKALVRFDGYGTEDEEEVLLRDLKSPPKPQRKNTCMYNYKGKDPDFQWRDPKSVV